MPWQYHVLVSSLQARATINLSVLLLHTMLPRVLITLFPWVHVQEFLTGGGADNWLRWWSEEQPLEVTAGGVVIPSTHVLDRSPVGLCWGTLHGSTGRLRFSDNTDRTFHFANVKNLQWHLLLISMYTSLKACKDTGLQMLTAVCLSLALHCLDDMKQCRRDWFDWFRIRPHRKMSVGTYGLPYWDRIMKLKQVCMLTIQGTTLCHSE